MIPIRIIYAMPLFNLAELIGVWKQTKCGITIKSDGTYGSIYDNFSEFKNKHPESSYRYGFSVVNEFNYIPPECNDWNDSPEEAIMDYMENCR